MRILGIDPGYAILGYGVVDASGTRLSAVDFGVIETTPDERMPARLKRLYDGTRALIERFGPTTRV
jgi:crossover junction endodeoxyribonuclease RuvC